MSPHELLILGALSKDFNITPEEEERSIGGAVVYSSVAAARLGADLLVITKLHSDDQAALDVFRQYNVPHLCRDSANTTSIRNTYTTADRDRRTCEAIAMADPFELDDIPEDVEADVYYMGGLMKGEFPESFVTAMADRGKTAIDVQGFLRVNENGPMVFRDWDRKREIIASVHFLKTDAAEAEILTGQTDRVQAARTLASWGAKEVVLTHSSELLVCVDDNIYTAPFTATTLSGRTGRGDTCFCTYCYWRKNHSPEQACRFAAALTSLKMESPGPFSGSTQDVEQSLRARY
ncbi:MAG: PfkB family carbohydrate kinase [Aeoliella sp.]